MAGTFALNTGGVAGISQILTTFDDGTSYDFLRLKSGSTVVDANTRHQATLRGIKIGAVAVHTES